MKYSRVVFPAFLLISLITYIPTIGSGFVFDFLGWQRVYNAGSFLDIFNCFGYKGNHQALHFFFYSLYSIFHTQGLPWYLIFCTIHAFNGWLMYKWVLQIISRWSIDINPVLVILVSILFLIHPYNVEPVVWKVCIHYLLSMTAVLSILLIIPKYLDTGHSKYFWAITGLFTLSLFLLELSFATPILLALYIFIEWMRKDSTAGALRRTVLLTGSVWGLLAGYLLLNKATLGSWVGHYGAQAHLNLDVIGMMATEVKYIVKHLFYGRFYSFKAKAYIFDNILFKPELIFFILTFCIGIIIWYLIKIKKWSGAVHLTFFCASAALLYVLPISNLYFYHLQIGMNDRYSYIPIAFSWIAVIVLIRKLPKWLSITFMSAIILIGLYYQQMTNHYWRESTLVLKSLKESFRWHDNSHVFVLNSPDNLKGIVMTSIYEAPSGIIELINYQTPKPFKGVMYDVFQYNMTTPEDGVTVEQTGPMQLKVTFKQWGNWWHHSGIGASAYENEYFKAEPLDYPYQITFKQFPEGSAIIYQDGNEWKEFKLEVFLLPPSPLKGEK